MLEELNPPTKVIRKFLKAWRDSEVMRSHNSHKDQSPPSVDGPDPAGIALSVSKRLIALFKKKRVLNIAAGLEMIAFGMTICSMV